MSPNNLIRIAGIAGIVSAVCTIGISFTIDQTTYAPTSPLYWVFVVGGGLAGILLAIGLYLLYRKEVPALSLIAVLLSTLGYLLFLATAFTPSKPGDIAVVLADTLSNIIGVALFSWLAYNTRKLPRALAFIGFANSIVAGTMYAVALGAGVNPTNPNHPLTGVVMALYLAYFILLLIWSMWTGIALAFGKARQAVVSPAN
ncbi:MAG: hypothetical protein HUU11_03210 [Anaerolineales bacterium]|nr:hypothetical protein [Anaerolineales bacterium]